MRPSLIICSYGRPEQLKACFATIDTEGLIAHQGELILVYMIEDKATAEVMKAYGASAKFLVKTIHTNRPGLSIARNAGISIASGDLLISTDDDCQMTPGYIGKVIAGMASGDYGYGGGSISDPYIQPPTIGHIEKQIVLAPNSLIMAGAISGANMFFKKEVFARIGGFREDMGAGSGTAFVGAEDLEMVTRASFNGYTGVLLPEPLIIHNHGRPPGSVEDKKSGHGYDLGRGAHYAYMMSHGIHEIWNSWASTGAPDSSRRMSRTTLERLKNEFEGASEYLKHCLENNIDLPADDA